VAHLAARLLKGDDYKGAARAALKLIDESEAAIHAHQIDRRKMVYEAVEGAMPAVGFREGVLQITGISRWYRAQQRLLHLPVK